MIVPEQASKTRFPWISKSVAVDIKFVIVNERRMPPNKLVPELQDPATWQKLRGLLRKGGRIMVNVGGSCVEAENRLRDGTVVMEETLGAMKEVLGKKLFVLNLGNRKDDSSLAFTGDLPHLEEWKKRLSGSLKCYAHMWTSYSQ